MLAVIFAYSTYIFDAHAFLIMLCKIPLVFNVYWHDKNFYIKELIPGEYFQ